MIAAAVTVAFATYSASKWNLANAISTRTDEKEFVDFAVDLAPDDPQTRYAAGVLYQKTLEPDDAARSLAEFEAAAALSPNNYLPWLELRAAFSGAGDSEASLRAIRRAVDLAPNYADVRWAYGNALIRAGEVEVGFENIRRAIHFLLSKPVGELRRLCLKSLIPAKLRSYGIPRRVCLLVATHAC